MNNTNNESSLKIVKKVRVKNHLGLHTRPATVIVKLLQDSKSVVSIANKKQSVNAKSVLSLLMLAAQKNTLLTITVEGQDAEETMAQLLAVFEDQFGE